MRMFKLEKLGPRVDNGSPAILNVITHPGTDFEKAFRSAQHLVQTTFEVEGVSGFRLTDEDGKSRSWFV